MAKSEVANTQSPDCFETVFVCFLNIVNFAYARFWRVAINILNIALYKFYIIINISEPAKGIPCFWMTVFKNVDMLSEMVQDHDDPIIKYLQDITLKLTEEPMVCVIATEFSKDNGK